MNKLFIILPAVAAITFFMLWWGTKNAKEIKEFDEPTPKFQPRKVTIVVSDTEKPKRKKKRYYNKKKPAVAQNAPVEKRPVGRPRKTT
jgi:hypothetical protein